MSQVSQAEAADLLSKLLSDRVPVQAFFFPTIGTRISLVGFVDSFTRDNAVVVSYPDRPLTSLADISISQNVSGSFRAAVSLCHKQEA